jgi:hypothetical protein
MLYYWLTTRKWANENNNSGHVDSTRVAKGTRIVILNFWWLIKPPVSKVKSGSLGVLPDFEVRVCILFFSVLCSCFRKLS